MKSFLAAAIGVSLLVFATACGSSSSTLYAVAMEGDPRNLDLEGVVVEIRQGSFTWRFSRSDFRGTPQNAVPHTRRINVRARDNIAVTASLIVAGDTIAVASAVLEPRDSYHWFIAIARSTDDPSGGCFSCWGGTSSLIDEKYTGEPGERLWLLWGGRDRGQGVF